MSKGLRSVFSAEQKLRRKYAKAGVATIQQRMADLRAAETLDTMRFVPGKCEELRHTAGYVLSLRLDGPWRLLFEPCHDPVPLHSGGNLDWTRVTRITILGIEDYHAKK